MRVLGVSSGPTDAAAAVIEDGRVLAAEAEERFTRVPRDGSFPARAIAGCLEVSGVDAASIDVVTVHQKPWNTLRRSLATDRRRGLRGFGSFVTDMPRFARDELVTGSRAADLLRRRGGHRPDVVYAEHVMSSSAAAFLPSRLSSAAILVVGDVGEWDTVAIAHGANHRIDVLAEQRHPDSLGALCAVVRRWCGLDESVDLGRFAQLASAGRPTFSETFAELVRVNDDGSVTVDARTFGWWEPHPERSRRLNRVFDGPPRAPGAPLTSRESDLACSLQEVLDRALVAMADRAHETTGESTLCLSGSLAANPASSAAVLARSSFERIWIPPDVGTAGCAAGAALWYWHSELGNSRNLSSPAFAEDGASGEDVDATELAQERAVVLTGGKVHPGEVVSVLDGLDVPHQALGGPAELAGEVAQELALGSAVGWFRGRGELGPLPYGSRCILRAVGSPGWEQARDGVEEPFVAVVAVGDLERCFDTQADAADLRFVPALPTTGRLVDPPVLSDRSPDGEAEARSVPTGSHGMVRVLAVHPAVDPDLHRVLGELGRGEAAPVLVAMPLAVPPEPPARTVQEASDVSRRKELSLLVVEDVLVRFRSW